jgi:hypothetical protein
VGPRPERNEVATTVANVISEAIGRAGKARALAKLIEPLVGREYADRTVSAWGRGDVMPPADVVIAAAAATGLSLDEAVVGIGLERSEVMRRLDQMERRVRDLEARVGSTSPHDVRGKASAMGALGELGEGLTDLEDQVFELGRQLGRSWDRPAGISYVDATSSDAERLARRVNALLSHYLEVASMVDAPRASYPPPPEPAAGPQELSGWLAAVVATLQDGITDLQERVAAVARHGNVGRAGRSTERGHSA